MSIRIAITDDHPMVISGLKNMLGDYPHIEITGSYTSGKALLEGLAAVPQQPDILLMDVCLPDIPGNELARTVKDTWPSIRIIAVTSLDTLFYVKDMLQQGCMGYLLKKSEQQTLIQAIEEVYRGEQFIEPMLKEQLLDSLLNTRKQAGAGTHLTRREKEILRLIVQEYTNQEIAEKLFLSESTVKNHRFSLLQKLDVKNSIGLARVAFQMGLIE